MLIALGIIAYLAVGIVLVAVFLAIAHDFPDVGPIVALAVILWPISLYFALMIMTFKVLYEIVMKLSEYLKTWQGRPGVGVKPDPDFDDEFL